MHNKKREKGRVQHKTLYKLLGINPDVYKQVLGVYFSETQGANFWLSVLTDLKTGGWKKFYRLHR